jgi:hypothetical protein
VRGRDKRHDTATLLAVVRLDDANSGAGPGTVVEVSGEPFRTVYARQHRHADQTVDPRVRIWRAMPGTKVGDRVCALALGAK